MSFDNGSTISGGDARDSGFQEAWFRQISSSTVLSFDEDEKGIKWLSEGGKDEVLPWISEESKNFDESQALNQSMLASTATPSSGMPFLKQISSASGSAFDEHVSSSSMATVCRSLLSASHIERWTEPDETLILFDWDDTLCPTHDILSINDVNQPHAGFDRAEAENHEAAVINLLHVATRIGNVQIVTMAEASWIQDCIAQVMPRVQNIIEELKIPICEARAFRTPHSIRQANADSRDPSHFYKTKAMHKIINEFYGKNSDRERSWKNILSIGDSDAERLALQDVVFRHIQRDRFGRWKDFRCKTVCLLPGSQITQLTQQLQAVARLLPSLVHHDGDLDVVLDMREVRACLEWPAEVDGDNQAELCGKLSGMLGGFVASTF